ncbi:hypothetical protein Tco_1095576 [Tanacetum coccineum]
MTSILTEKELDLFYSTYNIPTNLNLKLLGRDDSIKNSPKDQLLLIVCPCRRKAMVGCLFSKRGPSPCCILKNLDSLKNWNNHFFWIDAFVCPIIVSWYNDVFVKRDPLPSDNLVDLPLVDKLNEDRTLIRRYP